jgi:hypothetical protein
VTIQAPHLMSEVFRPHLNKKLDQLPNTATSKLDLQQEMINPADWNNMAPEGRYQWLLNYDRQHHPAFKVERYLAEAAVQIQMELEDQAASFKAEAIKAAQQGSRTEKYAFEEAATRVADISGRLHDGINGLLPEISREHDYRSSELQLLNTAAETFWKNATLSEADTCPTNSNVADWLRNEGFSADKAAQGASIIRPDKAPKGRRAKE